MELSVPDSPGDESLLLPLPGALVTSDQTHLPAEATAAVEVLAEITPGASARDTLAALDPIVRDVLDRWRAIEVTSDKAIPRQAEYDRYFRVRRVESSAPRTIYYDAIIVAYHRLLRESLNEHNLTPIELGQLRGAFDGVLFRLRAADRPVVVRRGRPGVSPPAAPPAGQVDVLRRWIRGHHALFVLIQGLLLAHGWRPCSAVRSSSGRCSARARRASSGKTR